jgi:hypothetical protein
MDYSIWGHRELVQELERRDRLDYEATRIEFYEREGCPTSDAQAVVDVENMRLMGTYRPPRSRR